MSSKKITVFLPDGLPKGTREIKIDQWSGKGICIPRNKLNSFIKNAEYADLLENACVYFLIGEQENVVLNKVYVGEADGLKKRIKQQESKHDWWKDVVVFISQDGTLTKTGVKYLESVCIERLRKIGKCTLANTNQPRLPNIPREDKEGLELFFDNIGFIMPLMGFDIFVQKDELISQDIVDALICTGKGVCAYGILLNDGKLKVLKDSEAVSNDAKSFKSHFYKGLKDELLKMGKLIVKGNKLIFVDDYIFDSPSAAAAIVLARPASGPKEWKKQDGKRLEDILRIE